MPKKKKRQTYVRKRIVSLEEVLKSIKTHPHCFSLRMQTYLHGIKCVRCGIEGKYFALERNSKGSSNKFHYNLYALDEEGNEIMMTSDHIIPKSKGGPNDVSNRQPMCSPCNTKKGNSICKEDATLYKERKSALVKDCLVTQN